MGIGFRESCFEEREARKKRAEIFYLKMKKQLL